MTQKQPDGQEIQRYRYRATASVSRTLVRREVTKPHPRRRQETRRVGPVEQPPVSHNRRRVTTPMQAVQPLSWAERQERYRQPPVEPPVQGRLVPRTLSQTGRAASAGPVRPTRISKPLPRQRPGSPIPVRSGQQRRSGSFWRRFFAFLCVLTIVTGGAIFALTSPTFQVQHVQVSGTHNQALIYTIQHMGLQGQDIFLLNQSALTRKLEVLPLVAVANLGVQMPDSLLVTVEERVPLLLWQSNGKTFGVAQDGMVIALQNELSDTEHLPTIVDKRVAPIKVGQHLNAADIAFAEQILEQLPGIGSLAPFALQYIDHIVEGTRTLPAAQTGSGSYTIASSQGWLAYLGNAQNSYSLASRLQELQQILSIASKQHLQLATIDLRFGLRPTYTLKS